MKKLLLAIFVLSSAWAQFTPNGLKKFDKASFLLLSGGSNIQLAQEVANILGVEIHSDVVRRYPDGEIKIKINESIRGKDVYIIQSTCSNNTISVNDSIMELYFLIRTCKRASAKSITAIIPYYAYSRQNKKSKSSQ